MHRQVWAGVALGLTGAVAGVGAAAGGQLIGMVAAVSSVGCALVILGLGAQNAERSRAREAERPGETERPGAAERPGETVRPGETDLAASIESLEPEPMLRWDASTGPETVTDPESGLLDHRVFSVTFERKVAAARRHLRPLSLVLLDVSAGLPSGDSRPAALAAFGTIVNQTLRESDVPCRVGDTTFGLILEDTPEPGGVWVAERLQIATSASGSAFVGPIRAAVATYPNHGFKAAEVLRNATGALARAVSRPSSDGDRFAPVEVPRPEA